MRPPTASALYVAYGVSELDCSWVPDDCPVVVVHNDEKLHPSACGRVNVTHVFPGGNRGFGGGVMAGLGAVTTPRVVVCNPDTRLTRDHWRALADGRPHDVITIRLRDASGRPTAVCSGYPTPLTLVIRTLGVGQLAPRGSRRRHAAQRLLGRWGQAEREALEGATGSWPLHERWISGAVFGIDADLLRDIGFDPGFFLYLEDVDLCRRIGQRFPDARAVVAEVEPGLHSVGGSATTSADRLRTSRERIHSARYYASRRSGRAWQAARILLAVIPSRATP